MSRDKIATMLETIKYRGPDGTGIYADEHVGLGHVRLSILDLSELGAQPMTSNCGRYVLAYNGEVYNFTVMREALKEHGVRLRSTGDTEALLEYIATFGMARCLEVSEGMFALALWDRVEKRLTLARDRHGIKPLYYAKASDGTVWFGSEMKCLLDFSGGPDFTTVNAAMLGLGCAYDFRTLLKGINSVRAGEFIVLELGAQPRHGRFFRLSDFINRAQYEELDKLSAGEAANRVHEALRQSMRLCMISDAPLAVLASGGIDSSLIAALANQNHPNLKLYHADVVNASETPAVKQLAKHLGCEMFSARITEQDTLDETAAVTFHYEMPLMYHTNAVPFYLVSKLARSHGIKVVLTGEGSDEYFIGYADQAIRPEVQRYRRSIGSIQNLMHRVNGLGRILWPRSSDSLAEQLKATLFRYELEARRGAAEANYSFITNWRNRQLSFMSLDMCEGNIPPLLHRNDRLGMAWGIESRFPFLGHSVASLALNMPPRFKVRGTWRFYDRRHPFLVDKWCIREVAGQYLPRGLSHRGKYAFRGPVYSRIKLNRQFFQDGFIADLYSLDCDRLDLMLEKSSAAWRSRLFLLEVWGRIYGRQESVDVIKELTRAMVSYN